MDPTEALAAMMAITGSDEAHCLPYLEATGFDAEQAVSLYLASDHHPSTAPPPPPPQAESHDIGRVTPQVATRLNDPGPTGGTGQAPRDWTGVANAAFAGGGGGDGEGALDKLYSAPSYAVRGSLADACTVAASGMRWVVVNIVRRSDWDSSRLNCDVWGSDVVRALAECYFTLWQAVDTDPDGATVMASYGAERRGLEPPFLLIVDPVTRTERKCITLPQLRGEDGSAGLDACRARDLLWDFYERHGAVKVPGQMAPPQAPQVDDDDELRAALAASLQSPAPPPGPSDPSDDAVPLEVSDSPTPGATPPVTPTPAADETTRQEEAEVAEVELDPYFATPEDPAAEILRLRLKLPSGAWSLTLRKTTPLCQFVLGIKTKLRRDGGPAGRIALLVGFPPRRVFEDGDPTAGTLGGLAGLRSGDVVTVHLVG